MRGVLTITARTSVGACITVVITWVVGWRAGHQSLRPEDLCDLRSISKERNAWAHC